jgi:hypothetical protein
LEEEAEESLEFWKESLMGDSSWSSEGHNADRNADWTEKKRSTSFQMGMRPLMVHYSKDLVYILSMP